MRSGMVAVVGRPNVGKSTLVNALVGRKVAIVSHKAQTTRHRIQGVANHAKGQIVFVDTPGLHTAQKRKLNRYMNQTAVAALDGVDLVLFVVEAQRWTDEDAAALERLRGLSTPMALVVNKVDRVKDKARLLGDLAALAARFDFAFVVPLSALRRANLEALTAEILQRLPEGPPLYPEGQLTGHDDAFAAAEIVREKLTRSLHEELPYALTVEIEKLEREAKIVRIEAVIWVEREGQKAIVIGADGATLKGIGSAARRDLEQWLGKKVFLKLWCKVKENWSDDPKALARFGYQGD
jgi:GTPase